MIKVFLPDPGEGAFCSIMRRLVTCFSRLSNCDDLTTSYFLVNAKNINNNEIYPLSLLALANSLEEIDRQHITVSFTAKLEGCNSIHNWLVSVTRTNIPMLSARRISVLPSSRNYSKEVNWIAEGIATGDFQQGIATSPDFSEIKELASPCFFYVSQKIIRLPSLKRRAEAETSRGTVNLMWPIPTEFNDAISYRLGKAPILIPEDDQDRRSLERQIDVALLQAVSKAVMDKFLSKIAVPSDAWFS